jgi:hypothetical protein
MTFDRLEDILQNGSHPFWSLRVLKGAGPQILEAAVVHLSEIVFEQPMPEIEIRSLAIRFQRTGVVVAVARRIESREVPMKITLLFIESVHECAEIDADRKFANRDFHP